MDRTSSLGVTSDWYCMLTVIPPCNRRPETHTHTPDEDDDENGVDSSLDDDDCTPALVVVKPIPPKSCPRRFEIRLAIKNYHLIETSFATYDLILSIMNCSGGERRTFTQSKR